MQITNSTTLTTSSNTLKANEAVDSVANNDSQSPSFNKSSIQLSDHAKAFQAIDTASNTIDDLLIKNMPEQQRQELEKTYQQLDTLFEKEKPTAEDEKRANSLMDNIDKTLNAAFENLPKNEKKIIDKLAQQIDKLESEIGLRENSDTYSKNEIVMRANPNMDNENEPQMLGIEAGGSGGPSDSEKSKKKSLTTAQLNALSSAELRKLSSNQLKKLNAAQLNKLSSAQLNTLDVSQLKRLSSAALSQLNDSQTAKLN